MQTFSTQSQDLERLAGLVVEEFSTALQIVNQGDLSPRHEQMIAQTYAGAIGQWYLLLKPLMLEAGRLEAESVGVYY